MKKKVLIIFAVILAVAIALEVMYLIDMYMIKNNKPVMFSTWGYEYAPPEIIGDIVSIVDKTKENSFVTCDSALEKIYEDGKNEYYLNCIKSKYVVVKYENGYEEDVKTALKNGVITIEDLDIFNIDYIVQKKEKQYENSFIATVIEETTTYIIVEPNENESESKSSDRIVVNYYRENKNYLYGIGTKVVICYTGGIMETYPAQINANTISILN